MYIAYYPATNSDLEAEQQETCMTVINKITFKHRSQMVGVDEGENEHYFEKVPIRKATAR